jgi:hypothetical protein
MINSHAELRAALDMLIKVADHAQAPAGTVCGPDGSARPAESPP